MKVIRANFLRVIFVCVLGVSSVAAVEGKELAQVNGAPLTEKDLHLSLGLLNEGQKSAALSDENSRREALQSLIDREVLAQEGEKNRLDQDPEFKDAMAAFRKQLLMSRLLEKKVASQMTPSAARKYFEAHKEQFSTDRVRVLHILLHDEAEARKVLKLAEDSKNDFQELAEKYSKDLNAKNNRGDIGFIGRDRMVPEFTNLAFSTPEGKVAGPIQTAYGYHVIKVVQRRFGKALEFDEVELPVRSALRQQLVRNYIDVLRKQAKIKVEDVGHTKNGKS